MVEFIMNKPVIGMVVYILKKKAGSYDPASFSL